MDTTEAQQNRYLALAVEADAKAAEPGNQYNAESWRSIAESYRALAKLLAKVSP